MKKTVLVYIDQARRDLLPAFLIGETLQKYYGYKVKYASVVDIYFKFFYYKPDLVLMGNVDLYHGNLAKFMSIYSIIVSLPTEQSIFDKKDFISRMIGGHNPHNKDYPHPDWSFVERVYLWGQFQYDALIGEDSLKGRMVITGSPRLTSLFIFDNKIKNKQKQSVKGACKIGVALENELNYLNISDFLFRKRDFEFIEYGGGVDVFMWCIARITLTELKAIEWIKNNLNKATKILVRPRLGDSMDNYKFLSEKNIDIDIDSFSNPYFFFNEIDVLLLYQSSIGTEAQIAGIPVVTLSGIDQTKLDKYEIEFNEARMNNYYVLNEYSELLDIEHVRDKASRLIDKDFLEFVSHNYYSPKYNSDGMVIHPSAFIAHDINNILNKENEIKYISSDEFYKEIKKFFPKLKFRIVNVFFNKVLYYSTFSAVVREFAVLPLMWVHYMYIYYKVKTGRISQLSKFVGFFGSEKREKYTLIFKELSERYAFYLNQ